MRYLVDGYNVTKRDPALATLGLGDQRESLVARLAVRGSDVLGSGDIVVVFDGVAGGGADSCRGQVAVRFSRDEPADDLIARMVADGVATTVVTSDDGLARRVTADGARVLPAESCFAGRTAPRRGRYPASTAGLPPGANKVTEELKKLWLDNEE